MKSIELYLDCPADEAIKILKRSTQETGFLSGYGSVRGQFRGNRFKIGIRAPNRIISSAYWHGSISSDGNTAILKASLTKRGVFNVPKSLLISSAIISSCGAPSLAYFIVTLNPHFEIALIVFLASLFTLLAGIFGNISSFEQEELEHFLPKIFLKYAKEPNRGKGSF